MPIPPNPILSSLNPNTGPQQTHVNITGLNLAGTFITFDGIPAALLYQTNTNIIAVAPNHAAGPVPVVATSGTLHSGALTFTYTTPALPVIASLNPNSGPVGTVVIIAGSNFGDNQNASTVTFNGVAASVISWSATSIQVTVPATATTGPVLVTVLGVASNGVTFTVTTPSNGGMLAPLNILAIPCTLFLNPVVLTLDPTNFDDQANGSTYSWKVEDVIAGRQPTINRVIISYRDLGVATITVTLSGNDDSGNALSINQVATIGTVAGSKKILSVVLGLALTAQNLQLNVTRPPAGGPVSITKVRMEGKVEMTTY
jgi:hypothetical protein